MSPTPVHPEYQQRVVLLATDNKNSVLAEVPANKTNPLVYSAYGHQSSPHEIITPLGFNGELREAHTGWYLLGNGYRAYNPRLMRFHSPDSLSPFGAGGLNAYMYCGGEPVMNKDSTGHFFIPSFTTLRYNLTAFVGRYQGNRAIGQSPVNALLSTVSGNGGLLNTLGVSGSKGLPFKTLPTSSYVPPTAKNGGYQHNVGGVPSSTPGSDASYNGSGLGTTTGSMWDRLAARDRSTQVATVSPNYGRSTQTAVVRPNQSTPPSTATASSSAAPSTPTARNGAAIQPYRPEQIGSSSSAWSGESGPSDWSSSSSNASVRGNRR